MNKKTFTKLLPISHIEYQIQDFKDLRVVPTTTLFYQLFLAKNKKDNKLHLIKKYSKKKILKLKLLILIQKEIETLNILGENPYTQYLYAHFEDQESIYLLLEQSTMGTLAQKLLKDHKINEQEALPLIKSLIEILYYLNINNIQHSNICCESLLLKKNDKKQLILKITDFYLPQELEYTPPEVIQKKERTQASDIWSMGVVIYKMLVGKTPFDGGLSKKKQDIMTNNILNGKYVLNSLSNGSKDLLMNIFQRKLNILDIKQHWWILGKKKSYINRSQEKDQNNIEIIVQEEQQNSQDLQSSNSSLANSTQILQARSSIKNKIKGHRRIQSKFVPIIQKDQDQLAYLQQQMLLLQQTLHQIKDDNLSLLSQLKLQSIDTQHISDQRFSVVTFNNYNSSHRQQFYQMQMRAIPQLKSEIFCIQSNIQELEQKKNDIKQANDQINYLDKQIIEQDQYKQELEKVSNNLIKQTKQLQEKREFMELQIDIFKQQEMIESKLKLQQQNLQFSDEDLLELNNQIDKELQYQNDQFTNRKTMNDNQKSLLDEQVQIELNIYQTQHDDKIGQLLRKHNEEIKNMRDKKNYLRDEIDKNEELLSNFDISTIDQQLQQLKSIKQQLTQDINNLDIEETNLIEIIKNELINIISIYLMIFCLFLPYVIAQFSVKLPSEQTQKNLQFNIANYGYVPYGQQIWGNLELAFPNDYCERMQFPNHLNPRFDGEESQQFILVARRGNCTFLQKSINAQQSGYVMLVLVDSKEEDIDSFEMISKDPSVEIRIPVIMIKHIDGEELIQNLEKVVLNDQYITAYIKFPLNFKGKTVEYSYWFSVMDKTSYEFLDQFYPFHTQMSSQLNFTPHYQLIKSSYAEHNNFTVQDSSCLCGGRYCAPDPDGTGPLVGQDAVVQVVKQLCIWQIDQQKWWKYVIKYQQICLNSYTDMLQCEEKAIDFAGLSYNKVMQCFNNSFTENNNMALGDNNLLKTEYNSHLQYSIFSWPELMVNDQRYKGSLYLETYKLNATTGVQDLFDTTHYGPLQMICRSFEENSMPKLCQEKIIGYIVDGQIIKHQAGQSTWIVWVCAIFVMASFMAVTMWIFKRKQRIEQNQILQENGNIYISQYYALKEKEGQIQ